MNIILVIMANIMVVVVSIMAVHEYFNLRRYASFTVPFTDKMVGLGVIDAGRRDGLLKEDRIGHYIGIALSMVVWLMLAKFIAGISGIFVFIIAALAQLVALKPDMQESASTRSQYFNAHKKDMDALKYHEYLKGVEGI